MRKHNRVRVVLGAAVFAAVFTICTVASAGGSSPWIDSSLEIQQQAAASAVPTTLLGAGNQDCFSDGGGCSVPTAYGASQDVSVNTGSKYYPVESYIDGRQHFMPIPNSPAFITYTTNAVYGLYLYFNYDFTSSVKLATGNGQNYYQVTAPPDSKLSNKSGQLLAGDPASISFSTNGQWMIISEPNVAILRVDLRTFQVLPFANGFSYNIGLAPAPKTAITNDGRYAIVASKAANRFEIYDLSTCAAVPDSFNGPVSCRYRDLGDQMRQQLPAYDFVDQARFLDDDTVAIYANYHSQTGSQTGRFIISDSGQPAQIDYLALGDSYISGEGAFDYVAGTDTSANLCHLSYLSYPFLIGADLGFNSYHSVACSGATTKDVIDTSAFYIGQANRKDSVTRAVLDGNGQAALDLSSFLPGYLDQLDFVKTYQPRAVTISIGGNDMGFSKVLIKCVLPGLSGNTCYGTYEERLELVRQINTTVFNNLIKSYAALKSASPPDTRIYAIGYPQIAKPGGDCGLNVHLNNDELIFAQQLTDYLDGVIQQAAGRAGVYYVDTQGALNGHRLCEAGPGSVAVNGITLGRDRPVSGLGPIGDESYHPNALGYRLLENKVLVSTDNLTAPMPAADPAAAPPPETGLQILDAPRGGAAVNTAEFDPNIAGDLVYRQVPSSVFINGASHALAGGASLQAVLHSDPISLGVYTTDRAGDLDQQVTVPADTPAGYHTLHFYGKDINGQNIDIYKDVWVACTADDIDCDGVADSTQGCIGVTPSGQDYDQDDVDDACDATITTPPAGNPAAPSLGDKIYASSMAPSQDPRFTNPVIAAGTVSEDGQNSAAVLAASVTKAKGSGSPPDNTAARSDYSLIPIVALGLPAAVIITRRRLL